MLHSVKYTHAHFMDIAHIITYTMPSVYSKYCMLQNTHTHTHTYLYMCVSCMANIWVFHFESNIEQRIS